MSNKYDKMTKAELIKRVKELEHLAERTFNCSIIFELDALDEDAVDDTLWEMVDLLQSKYDLGCADVGYDEA